MLKSSPIRLISCQQGDLGRKVRELSWESCVDNYESWIDCKNCDGNLKSLVDSWKNYNYDWDVGSDLVMIGHCCFGSMRNSGNFSSQDVRLSTGLLWGLEKAEFIGS